MPMSIRRKIRVRMIIEKIVILVAPEKREDLRRALASLLEPTRVEPGCIGCDLYCDAGNRNRFCFETRWESEQELIRHIRADRYRNLLILLELSSESPLVEFHDVVETRGLEFIRSVREKRCAT
jgi:quinol monooxygenase YgiN